MGSLDFLNGGKTPVIAVVGDSWTQETDKVHSTQTIDRVIARKLDFVDINLGIGGTGYNTPGAANQTFGDQNRLNKLISANPDGIIIVGSINDSNPNRASGVESAALTYFKAIREALPDTPVVVVGPQPSSGQLLISAEHHTNCAGLKAAVLAAGEGFVYRDWSGVADAQPVAYATKTQYSKGDLVHFQGGVYKLLDDWISASASAPLEEPEHFLPVSGSITGTGKDTAPKGDGRRDFFLQEDGAHPTAVGSEAFAADFAWHVELGFASLRRWVEKHDRQKRVISFAHKTASTVVKDWWKTTDKIVMALIGYANKDGSDAGASIPRLNDIKATPANVVHAIVYRTGDTTPTEGLYVVSSKWQITSSENVMTSIYNHSQSSLLAIEQASGRVISDDQLVEWCRENGYRVCFEYGPLNNNTPNESLQNQFRQFVMKWKDATDVSFVTQQSYTVAINITKSVAPDRTLFIYGTDKGNGDILLLPGTSYAAMADSLNERFLVSQVSSKAQIEQIPKAIGYTFYGESNWK